MTFFEVVERFRGYAVVRLKPKTGRTHQIRVHMAHAGAAVLCDRLYSGRARLMLGDLGRQSKREAAEQVLLERQALHARRIQFSHPDSGEAMDLEAPLPDDIQTVLDALRQWRAV